MKKLVPLAVAAVLAAPAAFAGSAAAPLVEPQIAAPAAPAMPASVDWTGPYAGVTLGFARTRWDEGRESHAGGGAHIGYNSDMGNWVVGGELGLAPGFDQTIGDREIKWGAAARLKAGPKFGPGGNTWGFGSLGLAHVRSDDVNGGDRQNSNGWLVGVGASHMLQNNVIVTGEINHSRFNGESDFRSTGVALGVSFRF
jgi:outer membrane immunogenic protein